MSEARTVWDVLIVGAGTAGMTAAIYTQRAGKKALVIEALTPGGQIVNTPEIENYPGLFGVSGYEYASKLFEQASTLGASFEFDSVLRVEREGTDEEAPSGTTTAVAEGSGIFVVTTAMSKYYAKAVILATGAKNRPLGVEKETELVGHGVSYCATCDGMFYKGKVAAVAGGGNTAIEDATFLTNYCEKVYVIHRRDAFRADAREVEKLKVHPNVEFVLNANVTKLLSKVPEPVQGGKTSPFAAASPFSAATAGASSSIGVAGGGIGVAGGLGTMAAQEKLCGIEVTDKFTGEVRTLAVDGLFIAIGQEPANQAFAEMAELDKGGYLVAGEDCKTRTPGIFTAGDCRTKEVRQLTTAASDGAVAALAACKYIDAM